MVRSFNLHPALLPGEADPGRGKTQHDQSGFNLVWIGAVMDASEAKAGAEETRPYLAFLIRTISIR